MDMPLLRNRANAGYEKQPVFKEKKNQRSSW
jgi:hypothetical protein